MTSQPHIYDVTVEWTGNTGPGTTGYRSYSRNHLVSAAGKPDLAASSDPAFRGDETRWSPEELLVASLSQCHLLWYLHVAAEAGVVVTGYVDDAVGRMVLDPTGAGRFTDVTLRPRVTVADESMRDRAQSLHVEANAKCFIAASVNFPVGHEPTTLTAARTV